MSWVQTGVSQVSFYPYYTQINCSTKGPNLYIKCKHRININQYKYQILPTIESWQNNVSDLESANELNSLSCSLVYLELLTCT